MPVFKVNTPVIQADPVVKVDVTAAEALPLGLNRFSLVVVDDTGNASEPIILSVIVKDTDKPTAVLDMVEDSGRIVEATVPFGTSFILSGARSSDKEPGKIKEYQFTLLDRR
jgi:hypothetical protein